MYHKLNRDRNGRWTRKNKTLTVLYFLFMAFIFCAYAWKVTHDEHIEVIQPAQAEEAPCRLMDGGYYCGTENDLYRWKEYLNGIEVPPEAEKPVQGNVGPHRAASVSMYSRKDSCHNMRGNLCLTAIGRDTEEGVTVACPKSLKLGTKVHIEGIGERTCEDRYADWVQEKHGDTFDVFTEDYREAVKFGRKTLEVTIM